MASSNKHCKPGEPLKASWYCMVLSVMDYMHSCMDPLASELHYSNIGVGSNSILGRPNVIYTVMQRSALQV